MHRYIKPLPMLWLIVGILVFTGCSKPKAPYFSTAHPQDNGVLLASEPLSQLPLYPTGCESVTAVMALRYAGLDVTIDRFIDNHLKQSSDFYKTNGTLYGPDPYEVFVGDPRSEASYGCMSPVIEQALRSYLKGKKEVLDCKGEDLKDLCHTYVDANTPVIVWATMDMREATAGNSWYLEDGRLFVWPAGEHCLLLVGYDDTSYFFNDPRYGTTVAYDHSATEQAYAALGKQALVIQ